MSTSVEAERVKHRPPSSRPQRLITDHITPESFFYETAQLPGLKPHQRAYDNSTQSFGGVRSMQIPAPTRSRYLMARIFNPITHYTKKVPLFEDGKELAERPSSESLEKSKYLRRRGYAASYLDDAKRQPFQGVMQSALSEDPRTFHRTRGTFSNYLDERFQNQSSNFRPDKEAKDSGGPRRAEAPTR